MIVFVKMPKPLWEIIKEEYISDKTGGIMYEQILVDFIFVAPFILIPLFALREISS